jgi:large subunit ribosomal protein L11
MKNIINLTLYIKAGQAESGPPLGTILGNIGVQTIKFCKEFNEFTKELPSYFILKVKILILENKNFSFTVEMPSIGYIISLLKKEEKIKKKNGEDSLLYYIQFEDLVKLAKFKFPNFNLNRSISIIKGSLCSSNIYIKI